MNLAKLPSKLPSAIKDVDILKEDSSLGPIHTHLDCVKAGAIQYHGHQNCQVKKY